MLKLREKLNARGFTIIEVLIVLAVAALILLIVFLAVPALQRNSRNTSRAEDASTTLAAMNEFYANNNAYPTGTAAATPACAWASPAMTWEAAGAGTQSSNNMGIYTGGTANCAVPTATYAHGSVASPAAGNNPAPYIFSAGPAAADTWGANVNGLAVVESATCASGSTVIAATGRNVAVIYGYESSPNNYVGKCVSS